MGPRDYDGTLSLYLRDRSSGKSSELHGHLKAARSNEHDISGTFTTPEGRFPVGGSIDKTITLLLGLPRGEARIAFGINIHDSAGTGSYAGDTISATYVPTPIKTPPRSHPAIPEPTKPSKSGSYFSG